MSPNGRLPMPGIPRPALAGLPTARLNPPWEDASLRVLFVRLSPFADAVRSTPHAVLFAWMRDVLPNALGDFAFFPDARQRRRLEEAGMPWMSGVQTGRPAADFDAVCVSCSVVQELPHLPLMLLRANFPMRAGERRKNGKFPPVLLGGSSAALARAVLFPDKDAFADGLYIGEIEPHAREFFETLQHTRGAGAAAAVQELARRIPAFYPIEPGRPADGGPVFPPAPARAAAPWKQPSSVVFDGAQADTVKLEISRGCPAFCSFCHEAWERRPYRELPADTILQTARRLAIETGASTVEVSAFNFNTHRDIARILDGLHRIFDRVNLMSQRADVLARHSWMLPLELAAEKRSFTLGVEGISERMRRFFAKGLRENELLAVLGALAAARVREIKLFFLIAGFENAADLEEFDAFCARFRLLLHRHRREAGPRVVFSAGFLVRMPFTPLQFDAPELNRAKLEFLSRRVEKTVTEHGFEFRMAMSWEEYVTGQLLVRPAAGAARILEESARRGLSCDPHVPPELAGLLAEAWRTDGETPETSTGDLSAPEKARKRAWETAAAFGDPPVCCAALAPGEAACHGCGACRGDAEREFLTKHQVAAPAANAASLLADWVRLKRQSRPLYVRVFIPEHLAGLSREMLEAHLQSAVLRACPELTGKLFRIREALWNHPAWEERVGAGWCGDTVLALYGVSKAVPELAPEDAQSVRAALESFLGSPVLGLLSFEPTGITAVRATVRWEAADRKQALETVRNWLSDLKIAFTEKRLSPPAGPEDAEVREFAVAPRDVRKMRRVTCRILPAGKNLVEAEVFAEGTAKYNPAPLLARMGSVPRLARIDGFDASFG